jgi:hypothetical protein
VAFNTAVAALFRYWLARRDGEALSAHRLVQAVTRDRLIAKPNLDSVFEERICFQWDRAPA